MTHPIRPAGLLARGVAAVLAATLTLGPVPVAG
jgi:hypothetical protein